MVVAVAVLRRLPSPGQRTMAVSLLRVRQMESRLTTLGLFNRPSTTLSPRASLSNSTRPIVSRLKSPLT
jgi:hypothetical protein